MSVLLLVSRGYFARYNPKFPRITSLFLRRNSLDMANYSSTPPFIPPDIQEVKAMVEELESLANKKRKSKRSPTCRKSSFDVNGSSGKHVINSWRFREWDYKLTNLPLYARGLFIGKNDKAQDEIVVRGYDKFFNTDEVPTSKWSTILSHTTGPYEISLKENGCIIFISGLWDGSLLVCSKHSTGPRADEVSHAVAGEQWIDKQLAAIGKSRNQLASELRSRNATAVAELCDDNFEEHILPYTGENAGLYLHGINLNIPKFVTYSGDLVQDFAQKWGFRKIPFLVYNDIQKVKEFLDEVAETGNYNGRDVEGFVIRCKAQHKDSNVFDDWFFKYKFEEPYLMYRQWRECTKALINGSESKPKKHVAITKEYLKFAERKFNENPGLTKEYLNNHGIIKLRDDFLKEKNARGTDLAKLELDPDSIPPKDYSNKIILIPIATIGCGKTTIAVSLTKIFGWGHIQNDNITGMDRPPRFTSKVLELLDKTPVVFADRNNSGRMERTQIIKHVNSSHPSVKLVALNYVHNTKLIEKIRKVTYQRVFSRGDNHQTIQAATDKEKAMKIMESFIERFDPVDINKEPDSGFDSVIDLDPTVDSRLNLETVVNKLHQTYPNIVSEVPSNEVLDDAINFAVNEYRHGVVQVTRDQTNRMSQNQLRKLSENKSAQKNVPIEYFALGYDRDQILQVLKTFLLVDSPDKGLFWRQLNEKDRIQSEFHTTLIHRKSSATHETLWKKYVNLYKKVDLTSENKSTKFECKVLLERIVWDQRLMTIVVRLIDEGWESANEVAHITIGTRGVQVKPKESNYLLKRWIENCDAKINTVAIEGHEVVTGTFKVVHSSSQS